MVTLQEGKSPPPEPKESKSDGEEITGSLSVSKFGPKKITGEQKTKTVTSKINMSPDITVMGSGGGGVGKDTEEVRTYASRWIFEGNMVAGERASNGHKSSKYRTLRWDLSENDLDLGVEHSNEFHTGFAFEHQKKPCYLKMEISGKLQKKRHQLKHRLKFPPSHRKDQGLTLTWIGLDKTDQFKTCLDPIADGLSRDLEWKNYIEIPVQLPDALPATFHEVPAVEQPGQSPSIPAITRSESVLSVNTTQEPNTITPAPPVGLLDQNTASLDPMTMYLTRGSVVFGGPAGVRQEIDQEPVFRRQNSSVASGGPAVGRKSMNKPEFQHQYKSSPTSQPGVIQEERIGVVKVIGDTSLVSGETEDADGRRMALLPILMLIQFLANCLGYFGQNSPLAGVTRGKKIKFVSETTE
ncbi:hypothetical protein EG329_004902 [Mollisiaceae sp. DMI_Dod_QoI]|nr:hypothetical protein EG329_004902 [Helotiales sp. DMI_Dod_QoI]